MTVKLINKARVSKIKTDATAADVKKGKWYAQ
jgi:hypothetical protein